MLLQLLVAAVVIRFGAPGNSKHYLGAIQDKIERLEACQGPRIVVVGGSNVAFGIHSPVMQRSFQMETVNLGLQASLGLSFQLECYLQHARSGDIVILSPEYHLLTGSEHQQGNRLMIDYMLQQCPSARRYLIRSDQNTWKHFFDNDGLWMAHQWVGRAFRSMRNEDTSDQIYSRAGFNEFGDVVAHYGRSAESLMPLGRVPPLNEETLEQTLTTLNRFQEDCQRQGVSVYFSYPPLMESLYAESEDTIEQLHRSLTGRLKIPMLNHPNEFAYPEERFYDTGYHLNQEAGAARTEFIAAAIAEEHFGRAVQTAVHDRRDVKPVTNPAAYASRHTDTTRSEPLAVRPRAVRDTRPLTRHGTPTPLEVSRWP